MSSPFSSRTLYLYHSHKSIAICKILLYNFLAMSFERPEREPQPHDSIEQVRVFLRNLFDTARKINEIKYNQIEESRTSYIPPKGTPVTYEKTKIDGVLREHILLVDPEDHDSSEISHSLSQLDSFSTDLVVRMFDRHMHVNRPVLAKDDTPLAETFYGEMYQITFDDPSDKDKKPIHYLFSPNGNFTLLSSEMDDDEAFTDAYAKAYVHQSFGEDEPLDMDSDTGELFLDWNAYVDDQELAFAWLTMLQTRNLANHGGPRRPR